MILQHQPHQKQTVLVGFSFVHKMACGPIPLWMMVCFDIKETFACLLDIVQGPQVDLSFSLCGMLLPAFTKAHHTAA